MVTRNHFNQLEVSPSNQAAKRGSVAARFGSLADAGTNQPLPLLALEYNHCEHDTKHADVCMSGVTHICTYPDQYV